MISLRLILNELCAEKTRLGLTILAVAWGTFAIAIMLAIGQGLRLTFGRAMDGVGKNVMFVKPGQTSRIFAGNGLNRQIRLTTEDVALIQKALPEIKWISPQYDFNASLKYGHKTYPARVIAVDPIYGKMRRIVPQPGGRFIDPLDQQNQRRVIVLGNKIAEHLFKPGVHPVGKTIKVSNQPFLVIGVMKKKLQMAGFPDAYLTWIPASTYVGLHQPLTISKFALVPQQAKANPFIKNEIRTLLAYKKHLDPNDVNIIKFRDFQQIQQKTNRLFTGMEIFLGIVGALTLMVAGVGIANVMFISVNRATREIGIRMAIGARGYQVLIHYVVEALLATALGGLIGLLLTKGVIAIIDWIPIHGGFFQRIGRPEPVLSPLVIAIVLTVLGIIGLAAGFFPARKAANIDPAIALRHE